MALVLMVALLVGGGGLSVASAQEEDAPTAGAAAAYGLDTIASTNATSTDDEPTTTTTTSTTSQGASEPKICAWEGATLRHGMTKYLVGRAHRRGSVFAECLDGQLRCYEDAGLADASRAHSRAVACARHALAQRQRDLDLEDQGSAAGTY